MTAGRRIRVAGWVALLVAAVLGAGWAAHDQALTRALDATARRGDSTLDLAVASLRGQLERFERLPALTALQPQVRALAADPLNAQLAAETDLWLEDIQTRLGASDVYLMDRGGTTRAASNHATETSFVGGNFAFRPYFTGAAAGGEGRFYALGTTSGKRGYYFGAPVGGPAGDVAGVLVFKIDLDAIEGAWGAGADEAILVTDPEGVVFLSGRPDWRFTAFLPLTPAARATLAETRRYADAVLRPFPATARTIRAGHPMIDVDEGRAARRYLMREAPMPEADWVLRVLIDTAPARRQALTAGGVAALALGSLMLAAAVVAQRRAQLRERLALQQAAREGLERRVEERTAELAAVNRRLEAEVAERTAAEQGLRQAQADLVQAGKMAALGQMSAALSHEFNQPLAAARTYADNAAVLLDRGRTADARGNIGRILGLIDRMAAISRSLRSFARAPGQRLRPVALPEVIEAAREIAGLRLRGAGAELSVDLAPGLPMAVAGPVRLQQVLVNVLTNAADAVEGAADRRILLTAGPGPLGIRISVRDHGPGVPAAVAPRIFDPFFSTKGVGKGLGLGLSISYNIVKDFGGDLSLHAPPGGGAEFRIDLRATDAGERAA
ncbi:MAG TPA: ATP-binding protein [Paracoccaceae bacterium]|nr:ATP-binding protein [Paracoccaceae bacterium]HMO70141.1 ATP-binding protein [Paracoccaceae bacterium]